MTRKTEYISKISDVGEFGLIHHLTNRFENRNISTRKGVGDDAAVMEYFNKQVLVTTDLLTEGVHFDLMYTPLKHLGYKAAIVNFSDIAAMNGQVKQITVSMALSSKFSLQAIEELYDGIFAACEKYEVDLVGGDTTSSLTGLTLCITALGEAEPEEIAYRSGAKINDIICVSGNLGASFLGLQVLQREKKVFTESNNIQPDLSGYDYVVGRHLKPEARFDVLDLLHKQGIQPTSMIDVSDGLSSELLHICKSSGVGCKVFHDKIPIHAETRKVADEFALSPVTCALNGGEDYELLFTVPIGDIKKIQALDGVSMIGHICDQELGTNLILENGDFVALTAQGWKAF